MITLLTIAVIVADLAIGMAAYKMSKSNTQAQATQAAFNATLLSLLAKHGESLANHEVRIVVLEKAG